MDAFVTFRVNGVQTAELYAGDAAAIGQYYHLLDWQTGEPMTDPGEGILISRRTAESFSLAPGSELELALGGVKTARVRVTGVFENYIGATMVMSGAAYERAFGEKYRPNIIKSAPMAKAKVI